MQTLLGESMNMHEDTDTMNWAGAVHLYKKKLRNWE